MIAIDKLQDLTPQHILYVTVEPYIMCAYALLKLTCIFLDAIMRGLEVVAQCLMCTVLDVHSVCGMQMYWLRKQMY